MTFDRTRDRPRVVFAHEVIEDPKGFLAELGREPTSIARDGHVLGVVVPYDLYNELTGYVEARRAYTLAELVLTEEGEAAMRALDMQLAEDDQGDDG